MNIAGVRRHEAALRFGSLCVVVSAPRDIYLDDLAAIYCTTLHRPDDCPPPGLRLEIVEAPGPKPLEVPPDGLVVTRDGALHTEAIVAQLSSEGSNARAVLTVYRVDTADDERRIYLVVLVNKILFWLGYVRQHASAVALDGVASIFIGDRGAGKSSTCAFLAKRGALVLADDDVLIRRDHQSFSVSGCDQTMRIMEDAERHLFGRLDISASDFGGVQKKEIATAEHFEAAPYADVPLRRIFFPSVSDDYRVRRMAKSEVVMRMLLTLRPSHRFAGAQDHQQTLAYVSDLAARVPAFELTLTRDFDGLNRLHEFLTGGSE